VACLVAPVKLSASVPSVCRSRLLRCDFLVDLEQVIGVKKSPCGPDGSEWRKSSYSVNNGQCVEVMTEMGTLVIRDSVNRTGSVTRYSANGWRSFLLQVKADRFPPKIIP